MKTSKSQFASCLAALALATSLTVSFTACSSDDDEPSVDEVLSTETTPVEFSFPSYKQYDRYTFFDYAGRTFIGSDTLVSRSGCKLDLRQGKHNLLWIKGLDNGGVYPEYWKYPGMVKYYDGVHYDPQSMTFETYGEPEDIHELSYAEQPLEVYPTLLPVQDVMFNKHVTSTIVVRVTDVTDKFPINEQTPVYDVEDLHYNQFIGSMKGYPYVRSVALAGKDYKYDGETFSSGIAATVHYSKYFTEIKYDVTDTWVNYAEVLCPLGGLDNIQLTPEIKDRDGRLIPTTVLPKFSIRRDSKTVLEGPLFSGSTADWKVTMEPY